MVIYQRIRRLLSQPLPVVFSKIGLFIFNQWKQFQYDLRDRLLPTHLPYKAIPEGKLRPMISSISDGQQFAPWGELLLRLSDKVLQHRFDLLGSGDVEVYHGMTCVGLEGYVYSSSVQRRLNKANQSVAQHIRQLISSHYRPIDWHIDFRSGYRWRDDVRSYNIKYGHLPGVDIKLPWELARMQHLSWLAITYIIHKNTLTQEKNNALVIEFQDQVLDFIAANPPRFGVNWVCTMDVAIRVANWLIAYDLFCSSGAVFTPSFETEFKRAVYAHGRHIVNHLEWFPDLRSNHYLANIAGLLFVAIYLPLSEETEGWFALASNELSKELLIQFQPDGSNFESSTSYHRLSAEMALYAVVLAHSSTLRCPTNYQDLLSHFLNIRASLPNALKQISTRSLTDDFFVEQLMRMAHFSRSIKRPDGLAVQIGDNDSGRFLKLTPDVRLLDENNLMIQTGNHDALVFGIEAACFGPELALRSIDALVIHALIKQPLSSKIHKVVLENFSCGLSAFPDFGVYIYRYPRLWLAVRCGSVGQKGRGGHAHNDQLALELCFDNIPFVVDPGTYLYTAVPDLRNNFRSTRAHATLVAEPGEQNGWDDGVGGLFSLNRVADAKVIEVLEKKFVGVHYGFTAPHTRTILINDASFTIIDDCDASNCFLMIPLAPGVQWTPVVMEGERCRLQLECSGVYVELKVNEGIVTVIDSYYSAAYGLCQPTNAVKVSHISHRCVWEMCILDSGHG